WWRLREWTLDVDLLDRLTKILPAEMKVIPIPLPDPAPDIKTIKPLLANSQRPFDVLPLPGAPARKKLETSFGSEDFDLARLETYRAELSQKLPRVPELEPLRLWPWCPWTPWFDCAPDLIFRVTQDCTERGTVIVDE